MITVACTKKLFEASSFVEEQDDGTIDALYKWHANVFRLAKKNNLIIMNNRTRYNFILFGMKKEHYKNFKPLFLQSLTDNLKAEGFSDAAISKYISKIDNITFTKTYDRSVLGSMTDMVKMTEFLIEDYLPIEQMNIIELNKKNNKSPILKLHNSPDRLMKEALAGM